MAASTQPVTLSASTVGPAGAADGLTVSATLRGITVIAKAIRTGHAF